MKRKAVSGIMLTLLLIGTLTLVFNIQPVKATGTIYIRPDGEVEGTDKIQRDGDVYTFTGNISIDYPSWEGVVVERNNLIVDGNGYTLQGFGGGTGFILFGVKNVTIQNINIKNFILGIYLESALNNRVSGNRISSNHHGILLHKYSSNNIFSRNNITNNRAFGVQLHFYSKNNIFYGNTVANNTEGIYLMQVADNNIFAGNIITNNGIGIYSEGEIGNNIFSENTITNNRLWGVWLFHRDNNNVFFGNTIANNKLGMVFWEYSCNNTVFGNTITNNSYGVALTWSSTGNRIYHNNFINNTPQAYDANPSSNDWHHPILLEGNYWSDYAGVDDGSGVGKHSIADDGIGDTLIPHPSADYDFYPLMSPWISSPEEAIEILVRDIESMNLQQGIDNSLDAKLDAVLKSLEALNADQRGDAVNKLYAFINEVEAQRGNKITDEQADYLISEAQRIIDLIEE